MSIRVQCACGKNFQAKDEHAGRKAKCPVCSAVVRIPEADIALSSEPSLDSERADSAAETRIADLLSEIKDLLAQHTARGGAGNERQIAPAKSGSVEYKVLTQKDKWFSGKFDPEKLEQAVNSYANQGWRVKGVATASVPGFGGNRDELIIVLER